MKKKRKFNWTDKKGTPVDDNFYRWASTDDDKKPENAPRLSKAEELDTGLEYYKDDDGWKVIPGGGGGGGDITRSEVIAMDAEVLKEAKLYTNSMIAVVKVEENQTINGYRVPKLTKDDLQTLFNANQNEHMALLKDSSSDNVYIVRHSAINEDDSQSVFIDYKGIMVLNYNVASGSDDVNTTYSLIGGGGGGDITRAEVEEMDAEVLRQAKEYADGKAFTPIIIEVEENQTINGYAVPKLTDEDLMRAYNGVVAGYPVIIVDATGNYFFVVKQADTDTEDFYICFDYCAVMILTYQLHGEDVTTTYTAITGQPEAFLKTINKTETETTTEVTIGDQDDVDTTFVIPKVVRQQAAGSILTSLTRLMIISIRLN